MNKSTNLQGDPVVIGVDVGSGSARTGIFDPAGTMMSYASREISLFRGPGEHVEQSGNEI